MLRRDLLKFIAAATGCAFVGIDGALAAPVARAPFTAHDRAMLDEIAETIIPRTDTPGAKDAANAIKSFKFEEGLKVDLWAHEPQLANAVAFAPDEKVAPAKAFDTLGQAAEYTGESSEFANVQRMLMSLEIKN